MNEIMKLIETFQTMGNMLSMLSSIGWVLMMLIPIITYVLHGFMLMHTGQKTGIDKNWMAFVPFAQTIYRLQFVEEQWWKMFFLEYSWLYGGLLFWIINAISNGSWGTFSKIVILFYLGCCVAYRLYYRYKFYKAFAVQPVLCILFLTVWAPFVRVVDLLIAFTECFAFTGEGTGRTVSQTARSVVNVRDRRQPDPGVSSAKTVKGSITGLTGMYAGQTIPLANREELIIGRDNANCNLIVDQNAEKVSRKHCGIAYIADSGNYQVVDYSSNGTSVDGGNRLVANMPTILQPGTVIALGSRENRFRLN